MTRLLLDVPSFCDTLSFSHGVSPKSQPRPLASALNQPTPGKRLIPRTTWLCKRTHVLWGIGESAAVKAHDCRPVGRKRLSPGRKLEGREIVESQLSAPQCTKIL
jgi:hypothetical protein